MTEDSSRRTRKLRFRQRFVNALGRAFFASAQWFPRKFLHGIASMLARLFFLISPRHRSLCLTHLKLAFGDRYTDGELLNLVRANYRNLARSMVDFIKSRSMSREELMSCFTSVIDEEHLKSAREKSPGGIIGLTGHFGNWEYSAHWMSQNGFPLTAVGRDQEDEALNEQIVAIREQWGTRNVPRSRYANKTLIAALKEGHILGLLSDQNAGRNGLFVPFFGEWASTFRGPAVFALKLGCPVVPVFNVRLPDDTYKLIIGPEIELIRDEDREYEIWASTYRMQRYIEALLVKYPEQWMWLHRRWKSRPDTEALEKGRRFLERYEKEVRDEFVIP